MNNQYISPIMLRYLVGLGLAMADYSTNFLNTAQGLPHGLIVATPLLIVFLSQLHDMFKAYLEHKSQVHQDTITLQQSQLDLQAKSLELGQQHVALQQKAQAPIHDY